MEFAVAKALKPSLRREFVFQQTLGEELFSFNANTVVAGEDFSVDDLLDFSNGDVIHHENNNEEEEEKDNSSLSSHSLSEDNNSSNSTDASYDSIFSTELLVPVSLSLSLSVCVFCKIEIEILGIWFTG
jgi:hypothetical protein